MWASSATILLTGCLLLASPAVAGVVLELKTVYPPDSDREPSQHKLSIEGMNWKSEIHGQDSIFHGASGEMVMVNHRTRTYRVVDYEGLRQVLGKVQQQLEGFVNEVQELDPEKAAEVEKTLSQRLGHNLPEPSPSEFRETGERADHQGFPCVRWDVFRDGEKVREVWVTDWDNVPGGPQIKEHIQHQADFFDKLFAPYGEVMGASMSGGLRKLVEYYPQVGGMPVVTRNFVDGELESEEIVESVTEQELGAETFEPPKDYQAK